MAVEAVAPASIARIGREPVDSDRSALHGERADGTSEAGLPALRRLSQSLFRSMIAAPHACAMPGEGQWTAIDSLALACESADYLCPECGSAWRRRHG